MAGVSVKITGIDECVARLNAMKKDLRGEVIRKGITAEAETIRQTLDSAAPVGQYADRGGRRDYASGKKRPGPIKGNVIIYERKRSDLYSQADADNAVSLLVGPSKQRGKPFYAYFQEKGFQHTTNKSRIRVVREGRLFKAMHTGGKAVRAKHWAENAMKSVGDKAEKVLIATVKKAMGLT